MRKPTSQEMGFLLGALVIGQAAAQIPDEPQLQTVVVTASYINPISTGVTLTQGDLDLAAYSSQHAGGPSSPDFYRSYQCAAAYNAPPYRQIRKSLSWTNQYGFGYFNSAGNPGGFISSYTPFPPTVPPPYGTWSVIDGYTGENPTGHVNLTIIFRTGSNQGFDYEVEVLAHELAHQNNADEAAARAAGEAARAAYLADHGARCGG